MCVYSIIRILRFQSNIIVICTYDMAGVRSGKTVTTIDTSTGEITGTTEYKYTTLSGKLVRVEYNTTILDIVYDESGQPFSIRYKSNPTKEGVVYYYVLNAQGDVIGLLNSSGELVVEYKYDPWGKLLETIIGVDETDSKYAAYNNMGLRNPLRYRGYIYDRDTGLYYLQSRYYDPAIGRFINADTYTTTDADGLLSTNMFAYCENNPVMGVDPTGEFSMFAAANFVIGAVTGAASQIISNIATGQKWSSGVVGAALGGGTYNVVSLVTGGNLVLASAAGSAVEATTNEVGTYLNGDKKLNMENIKNSFLNITKKTIGNSLAVGATGYAASKIVKTSANWFQPQKLKSCFMGKYAKKVEAQSGIQGFMMSIYNTGKYYIGKLF